MFTTKEELYGREKVSSYFRERYFHQSSPARLVIHESAFHAMGDAVWYEYEFTSIRHAAGCADGAWPCARKPPAVGAWQACPIPKCSSSRARLPEQAAKASREEDWLSRLRGLSCAFLTRCAVRLPS